MTSAQQSSVTPRKAMLAKLAALHRKIDKQVVRTSRTHAGRLRCGRGCTSCCTDEITVFPVEAEYLRHHHAKLLAHGSPHQTGSCAFLDDRGACRVYEHRPYVCRTHGLPLHWIDELVDGTIVARRDICPLNDTGAPIEELPEDQCWVIGPFEEALARLQYAFGKGSMERVALRDLFKKKVRQS